MSSARSNYLDGAAWRTATWSAPFVVQLTLAALLVVMWLLGKWPFETHSAYAGERAWMLTSTVIAALVSLVIGAMFLRSPSARNRGIGLSVAASAVVVLVGGAIYAYLILR